MSLGCYLEFINRSFKSITVTAHITEVKNWEKGGGRPDEYFNNRRITYYASDDMEMNEMLTDCNGKFYFDIQVENENGMTQKQRVPEQGCFNLKEGRKSQVHRNEYYFDQNGFFVRVSRGKKLRRIGEEDTNYGDRKGIFKVEVFSSSQRRLAILTDPHLEDSNKHECSAFLDAIVKLQNRPDFIVVCGDLTANNRSAERKLVENNFIGGLETRNFSVCEGLGNHDVRHFALDGGMTDYVKNRKREADGKLVDYNKDTNKKLHYHWDFLLSKDDHYIKVHCFMLNLVPGYNEVSQVAEYGGKKKSDDVKRVEKDERNPLYSLNYLEAYLKNYKENNSKIRNVALLFFHINYESDNVGSDGFGPERWWSYSGREDFSNVIDDPKVCKVIGTFFGHEHSQITRVETLRYPASPSTEFKLKGFKVAAFLVNTTFLDLELVKGKDDYVLKGSVKYLKTNEIGQEINNYKTVEQFSFNFQDL